MNNDILTSASTVNGENNCKGNQKQTKHTTKFSRAHMIIPIEDMNWAMEQKPSIYKLWGECWRCDPYGSRWMPLNTDLKDKTLKLAKAALRKRGFFEFKTEMRMLENKLFYETYVMNLHGSRRREFWEEEIYDHTEDSTLEENEVFNDSLQGNSQPPLGYSIGGGGVIENPTPPTENLTQQSFQKPSVTSQERLSNSSEELLRRDNPPSQPKTQDKPTSLISHLEAAEMGVMPPDEVIEQLRDSDYWVGFVYAAKKHGWDLTQWCSPTIDPEMKEKRAAQLQELKEKARKKRF